MLSFADYFAMLQSALSAKQAQQTNLRRYSIRCERINAITSGPFPETGIAHRFNLAGGWLVWRPARNVTRHEFTELLTFSSQLSCFAKAQHCSAASSTQFDCPKQSRLWQFERCTNFAVSATFPAGLSSCSLPWYTQRL